MIYLKHKSYLIMVYIIVQYTTSTQTIVLSLKPCYSSREHSSLRNIVISFFETEYLSNLHTIQRPCWKILKYFQLRIIFLYSKKNCKYLITKNVPFVICIGCKFNYSSLGFLSRLCSFILISKGTFYTLPADRC